MEINERKFLGKILPFLIALFFFLNQNILLAQTLEIPQDIFIAATVQPWLYFEVSPTTLILSPDLVSSEGVFNIAETEDVILKVATNNRDGWEIKIKGKNGGLKSTASNYLLASVNGTSTLIAGKEGFGAQATTTFSEVLINPIYDYYGTDIVGEISTDNKILVWKFSRNSVMEVAKLKIKATASVITPAGGDYEEELMFTILPLI